MSFQTKKLKSDSLCFRVTWNKQTTLNEKNEQVEKREITKLLIVKDNRDLLIKHNHKGPLKMKKIADFMKNCCSGIASEELKKSERVVEFEGKKQEKGRRQRKQVSAMKKDPNQLILNVQVGQEREEPYRNSITSQDNPRVPINPSMTSQRLGAFQSSHLTIQQQGTFVSSQFNNSFQEGSGHFLIPSHEIIPSLSQNQAPPEIDNQNFRNFQTPKFGAHVEYEDEKEASGPSISLVSITYQKQNGGGAHQRSSKLHFDYFSSIAMILNRKKGSSQKRRIGHWTHEQRNDHQQETRNYSSRKRRGKLI